MAHSLEHTLEDVMISTCKLLLPPLLHHTASHHTGYNEWYSGSGNYMMILKIRSSTENELCNRKSVAFSTFHHLFTNCFAIVLQQLRDMTR